MDVYQIPMASTRDSHSHHEELVVEPLGLLRRAAAEALGGLTQLKLGDQPTILISRCGPARDLFDDPDAAFVKPKVRLWQSLLGDSVLSTNGPAWEAAHGRVRLVTGRTASAAVTEGAAHAATERAATWPSYGSVELLPEMRRMALTSILDLFVGTPNEVDVSAFTSAVDAVLRHIQAAESAVRGSVPSHSEIAFADSVTDLRRQGSSLARQWVRRASPGVLRQNLYAYDGHPEQAIDDLLAYVIAGYESTATTLTWSLLLLAQEKHKKDLAQAAPKPRSAATHSPDNTDRLSRLVVSETLRLFPPSWLILRAARRPTVLAGITVPRGTLILCSPYLIHRDPDVFHLPDHFHPGRWESSEGSMLPRGSYIPFGGGRRACPGKSLAGTAASTMLSTLVRAYRFTYLPKFLEPQVQVTLQPPSGAVVQVSRRSCPV